MSEHTLEPDGQPLDVAAVVVPELLRLRENHPDLPPLDALRFDTDGAWAQPYLALAPATALAAWARVLPGGGRYQARQADWHAGTQISLTGRLGPYLMTLAVITWEVIEPGEMTNATLHTLAAAEVANSHRPTQRVTTS